MGQLIFGSEGIPSPADIGCVSVGVSGEVPHLGLQGELKGKRSIVHVMQPLFSKFTSSRHKFKRTS
jgi:hypothetical protein